MYAISKGKHMKNIAASCMKTHGRLAMVLLMAVMVLLTLPAMAQDDEVRPSKVDIYGGFSYFTRQTDTQQGYGFPTMPYGVIGQGAYFFRRSIGVEAGGSYQMAYKNDNLYFLQGGPIFRFVPKHSGLSIFAHGLAGAVNISGPNIVATTTPLTFSYYNAATWGQASHVDSSGAGGLPNCARELRPSDSNQRRQSFL